MYFECQQTVHTHNDSPTDNRGVHSSVLLLFDWAKRASASWAQPHRINTLADLRKAMDVTPQVFTNWKKRGLSVDGAMRAELLFGIPTSSLLAEQLIAGEAPARWMESQHADGGAGSSRPGQAHQVRLLGDDSLPLMSWEAMMNTSELPKRFRVALLDAALAPDLQPGDELHFDRTLEPAAGDLVLLKDPAGHLMVRQLQQALPQQWVAVAPNTAFAPLVLADHGLELVAVSFGETRRRRRSAR
jgi:hypothetical protein